MRCASVSTPLLSLRGVVRSVSMGTLRAANSVWQPDLPQLWSALYRSTVRQ
jgi:hypothetical protein